MKNYSVNFNANPDVGVFQLQNKQLVFVVDNAIDHPEKLVELAQEYRDDFVYAPGSAFPGRQLLMPDNFSAKLDDFFRLHIRSLLKSRRSIHMYSRLSCVTLAAQTLDARQRICHRDSAGVNPGHTISASVLYLFEDASLGGTVFFQPVSSDAVTEGLANDAGVMAPMQFESTYYWPASYMTQSNAYFQVVGRVPAKWNRMIFYDGSIFHSSDITEPGKLDAAAGVGRLTVNGFFTCTRRAQ